MYKRLNGGGAAAQAVVAPPDTLRVPRAVPDGAARLAWGLAVAVVAAAAGACNILDDDQDLPTVARVEITGNAPGDLELVVSDDFQRVADFDQGARYTVLVQADTSFVQPDFAKDYDIEASSRFFVRLTNHSAEIAQISLLVAFDGEVSYSQRATIAEGGALEFSEIFYGT
ncbi:MAG: hypothetical protein OXE96_15720 [Gemmatimonadetes bacterium]|nr:hypothetical protein [Gemmatimonadota bacterium]